MAATHIYPFSKTEEFIEKAKNVHGDKYDYSLVEYKNNATKVTIICLDHGEFEQRPGNHLNGQSCPKCGNERKGNRSGGESQRSNTKDFIERAKEIHGHDKYDYSLAEYKNAHTKVTIICPKHGEFEQSPNKHLMGQGCQKCYNESKKGTFNKKFLNKKFLKDKPERAKENCIFYIIQLFNNEESFIKCGITQKTILERFHGMKDYNYKIVDLLETTLEKAINLEDYFDEKFEKYWPKNKFCGYTECFQLEERENILQINFK